MGARYSIGRVLAVVVVTCTAAAPALGQNETITITGTLVPGQPLNEVNIPVAWQPGQEVPLTATDQFMRIEITRGAETVKILFGPADPVNLGTATATLRDSPLSPPGQPHVELYLKPGTGSAYLAGTTPYGGAGGGAATSDGSIILIRTYGAADLDRFFFLDKQDRAHWMRVANRQDTSERQQPTNVNVYVDVTRPPNVEVRPPRPIPAPPKDPTNEFVATMVGLAADAGLPRPQGW